MPEQTAGALRVFAWEPQPAAWAVVTGWVEDFCVRCPAAAALAMRMAEQTGTRFVDWVDYLVIPREDSRVQGLADVGYEAQPGPAGLGPAPEPTWPWFSTGGASGFSDVPITIYRHAGGLFPPIIVGDALIFEVALKAACVADFAAVHRIENPIDGPPLGLFRRLIVASNADTRLVVVERHGYRGFSVPPFHAAEAVTRLEHFERFRIRRRDFDDDAAGLEHTAALIDKALGTGIDAAVVCDLFFAAEREYWMGRNRAAQVQYARQQRLGLGWANHDHHTYRSSRENLTGLIGLWERLGFVARERFYAGAEAGWGAQVMEHPVAGIVTFNDVDLSPDELMGDLAHEPLPPRAELGTIGLWCGLHGDSILRAGMHHLECQFDFEALRRQLEAEHAVKMMAPFTEFPYLRQAFTEGERWSVAEPRIGRLLEAGRITADQAAQFREHGAIGSHLENLERNDGFKGFNQTGVSQIIAATDPRRNQALGSEK